MSILGGAIGAGVIMAAIAHEQSLAREAEVVNMKRMVGEALAKERAARRSRLDGMRDVTNARMNMKLMRSGLMPMGGRAARAVQLSDMASRMRLGKEHVPGPDYEGF